ncbi:HNH endonuclease [Kitasatospora sp. NPDC058048]|uniref:HNH endonuclease n=1 Tax=Kitasatospora sp. NPDC058048 TaxID=3346313 RepID=UPI0036D7F8D2
MRSIIASRQEEEVLVGEYLNWQEGNPIVPFENPRVTGPARGRCALHRWFAPGNLRCTYCGVEVFCLCGQAGLGPAIRAQLTEFQIALREATLDHLLAKNLGGGTEASNVAVACRRCNCSKGDRRFPGEWIPHRDENTFVGGGELPDLSELSPRARRLGLLVEDIDTTEMGPTVREVAGLLSWRPDTVHRTLEEMFRFGAFHVTAFPCAPSARYFDPIADTSGCFAGSLWVDGWL